MKKWEIPEVYNLGVNSTQSKDRPDNDSISCSASFPSEPDKSQNGWWPFN